MGIRHLADSLSFHNANLQDDGTLKGLALNPLVNGYNYFIRVGLWYTRYYDDVAWVYNVLK